MRQRKIPREGSKAFREQKALAYHGLHLAYVTERTQSGERVLGKNGFVHVSAGVLALFCEQKCVFSAEVAALSFSELLSGNGVILRGVDKDTGEERTVIAYFSYHRK